MLPSGGCCRVLFLGQAFSPPSLDALEWCFGFILMISFEVRPYEDMERYNNDERDWHGQRPVDPEAVADDSASRRRVPDEHVHGKECLMQ